MKQGKQTNLAEPKLEYHQTIITIKGYGNVFPLIIEKGGVNCRFGKYHFYGCPIKTKLNGLSEFHQTISHSHKRNAYT
ncbi:hypothetical protein pb186bvf_007838 [Paramecium bursaria]